MASITHTHTRLGARESGRPGNPCFGIPYTKHPLPPWCPSHTHTTRLGAREPERLGNPRFGILYDEHPLSLMVSITHIRLGARVLGVRETLALELHMINTPFFYGVQHTHARLRAREPGRPGNHRFRNPYNKHPLPLWCPSHTNTLGWAPGSLGVRKPLLWDSIY